MPEKYLQSFGAYVRFARGQPEFMEMESERSENFFEIPSEGVTVLEQGADLHSALCSELEVPRWSVVSFDKREAGGLTYPQASALMAELDERKVAGLCIVTDDAAARIDG